MWKQSSVLALWAVIPLAAIAAASPAWAQTWTVSTLDTGGDVGRFADLQVDSAGELCVVYLRTDNHTLKTVFTASGTWGTPEVIDASGTVGDGCALALDAGGTKRTCYRRTDSGAGWYAGPEAVRSWTASAIVQEGDVGRSACIQMDANGDIAVAYRHESSGALHHIRRTGGAWGSPVIVDPGPGRGRYFDLARRPEGGYAFSEYSSTEGAAFLADPVLQGRSWSVEAAVADPDDVGGNLCLYEDSGGSLVAAYRNATQGSLQYIVREGEAWSAPVTVDPGPGRGQYFDVADHAGIGYAFSEYSAATGAVLLADREIHSAPWTIETALADTADVGRNAVLVPEPQGDLLVAYRNATRGSLQYVRRAGDAWQPPITVDPGPNRGTYFDLAARPDSGYAFSEYDSRIGAVLLADPVVRPRSFQIHLGDPHCDAARQLSLFAGSPDRLECTYLASGPSGVPQLRVADIIPDSAYVVTVVVDSVAAALTDAVRPDLFVTPEQDGFVSFRHGVTHHLYLATSDSFRVVPAAVPDDPGLPPPSVAAATVLSGSRPNPAPAGVRVLFTSAESTTGAFELYDTQGRLVHRDPLQCRKGENEHWFDGRSSDGARLAAGVYYLRLQVGKTTLGPRKIVLLGASGPGR